MNFFSKLIVIILAILSVMYVKEKIFTDGFDFNFFNKNKITEEEIWEPETPQKQEDPQTQKAETKEKETVSVYFTTTTNASLKKVTREVPANKTKLETAIKELLKGPNAKEKKQNYSSEIPKGVKLLSIKDQGSLIIIDLSDDFQYGGGTESLYTRLNQLIKTVVEAKPEKPVFLYINGQKAEVIGGEGLMITQPLSETSLNG